MGTFSPPQKVLFWRPEGMLFWKQELGSWTVPLAKVFGSSSYSWTGNPKWSGEGVSAFKYVMCLRKKFQEWVGVIPTNSWKNIFGWYARYQSASYCMYIVKIVTTIKSLCLGLLRRKALDSIAIWQSFFEP